MVGTCSGVACLDNILVLLCFDNACGCRRIDSPALFNCPARLVFRKQSGLNFMGGGWHFDALCFEVHVCCCIHAWLESRAIEIKRVQLAFIFSKWHCYHLWNENQSSWIVSRKDRNIRIRPGIDCMPFGMFSKKMTGFWLSLMQIPMLWLLPWRSRSFCVTGWRV